MSQSTSRDERLRTEFNEWARAGKGESMERGHRPVGEQAIELIRLPVNARVLDLGCGSGWATRLMAEKAKDGRIVGIDISDEMIQLARQQSAAFENVEFYVASAEQLPFPDDEFTHAFSMESLYYYEDMASALKAIARVLDHGGMFVCVVDLFKENRPSHQWVEQLKVPVQLLSIAQYRKLFAEAGFINVQDRRLYDPAPLPESYNGTSFRNLEELIEYKQAGSLMLSGEVA